MVLSSQQHSVRRAGPEEPCVSAPRALPPPPRRAPPQPSDHVADTGRPSHAVLPTACAVGSASVLSRPALTRHLCYLWERRVLTPRVVVCFCPHVLTV